MSPRTMILAGLGALAIAATAAPAHADRDRGHRQGWNGWRYQGYGPGRWGRPPPYRPWVYAPPPVFYAPPPVYYAPPPVYYAPPPVFSFGLTVP